MASSVVTTTLYVDSQGLYGPPNRQFVVYGYDNAAYFYTGIPQGQYWYLTEKVVWSFDTGNGVLSSTIVDGTYMFSATPGAAESVSFGAPYDKYYAGSNTFTVTLGHIPNVYLNSQSSDTKSITVTVPALYTIGSPASIINEGSGGVFSVHTNYYAGSNFNYSFSGISSSRVQGGTLSGVATVDSNGDAKIPFYVIDNSQPDVDTTVQLTVFNQAVPTSSWSNKTYTKFVVHDNSTPTAPTYKISGNTSVNEGSSDLLTIQTTGLSKGATFNYSISGIDATRIVGSSLNGIATVDASGNATINLGIVANNHTDGPTTAIVNIANGAATYSVVVNDTSLTPVVVPIYTISGNSSVNEGDTDYLSVHTTGLSAGSSLSYVISGIDASRVAGNTLSGSVTVDASGNTTIPFSVLANNHTDGPTTAIVNIANGAATYSISVKDTSQTSVATPTYQFRTGNSTVSEGTTGYSYAIYTTGLNQGTAVPYSFSGIDSSRVVGNSLAGTATVDSSGYLTIPFAVIANNHTDGPTNVTLNVANGGLTYAILVEDTSKTPAGTYAISGNSSVNEGATNNLSLHTTGLPSGTAVEYLISGIDASRIVGNSLNGVATVDALGNAVIPFSVVANNHTDGSTRAVISIANGATTYSIVVNDTSLTPATTQTLQVGSPTGAVHSTTGNDAISGIYGGDTTAIYSGASVGYKLLVNGIGQTTVYDSQVGRDGTDTLTNIQNLKFADSNVQTKWFSEAISLSQSNPSQFSTLTKMYIAYFNRAPDAVGLYYWASNIFEGATTSQVAQSFFASSEAIATFGTVNKNSSSADLTNFVNGVYQNVLNRASDSEGLNFWVNTLKTGALAPGDFILEIINSVNAQTGTEDKLYMTSKQSVGSHFAITNGLTDTTQAKAVMSTFNTTYLASGPTAAINAANVQSDGYLAHIATTPELVVQLVGVSV